MTTPPTGQVTDRPETRTDASPVGRCLNCTYLLAAAPGGGLLHIQLDICAVCLGAPAGITCPADHDAHPCLAPKANPCSVCRGPAAPKSPYCLVCRYLYGADWWVER